MRKQIIVVLSIISIIGLFYIKNSPAQNIQSKVKSGVYIPHIPLQLITISTLPIPNNDEDYAFMQCIDKTCNIVIGVFSKMPRYIKLYQDSNIDGTVDLIYIWYVDTKSHKIHNQPKNLINPEQFKKMKEDIFNGNRSEIKPNKEGVDFLNPVLMDSSNMSKWNNGFTVHKYDIDKIKTSRVIYSFSGENANGYNLVFHVLYDFVGNTKMQPIIPNSIYCKNSYDPFIIEKVSELIKKAKKYYIEP